MNHRLDRKHKLLSAVLASVNQEGWTERAFDLGVKNSGATAVEARKLFPRGVADCVDAFHRRIDEAVQARIDGKRNFAAMRVRDKVAFAVRARLEYLEPHREAVRRLLVWSVLPGHLRGSAQALWQSADRIWIAAGDTATDYNRYTKRILLIGVMKATLAFWLNDASPDCRDTWAFLDRRIEDIMKLGKGIGVIKTIGVSDILSFVRGRFAA